MPAKAVELESVNVHLGGNSILRDVTFSVRTGELVGIIGPNGAGKTTLLRALLGMCLVSPGGLTVLGENPTALRGRELARFRTRVAYLPQLHFGPGGVPLTVREVVDISRAGRAGLLRSPGADDHRVVSAWIERMGLSELAERPYAELSGGQQRKVQLARALAQQPEMLLLDEPTANLDLYWQETLISLIEEVAAETGLTILLVTHDLSLLPPSCDRILVLAGGERQALGPPDEVVVPEVLLSLYGMEVQVERRHGRYHVFAGEALHDA